MSCRAGGTNPSEEGAASTSVSTPPSASPAPALQSQEAAKWFPYARHGWEWKGHRINYHTAGCGKPVLLVHGFGANARHWRKTVPALVAEGYKVYAIDLLGFGESDKPGDMGFEFKTEEWRDLVLDFCLEFVNEPVTLVGNSIGSLTCILAAAGAKERGVPVRGLVLLNTAGAMNNKGVSEDWRVILALPLFSLIDALLKIPAVSQSLFNGFRSRDNIRQVLSQVYDNQANVDDDLVELIYLPSEDKGALETFVSILTGPPGPRPDKLVREGKVDVPILFLWGDKDPFTPMDGPIGQYFKGLPEERDDVTFVTLPSVGHCPHDDRPDLVHAEMLPWLENLHA